MNKPRKMPGPSGRTGRGVFLLWVAVFTSTPIAARGATLTRFSLAVSPAASPSEPASPASLRSTPFVLAAVNLPNHAITSPAASAASPRPRHARAWLELTGFMIYSQTRYWIKWAQFIEDHQFKLTFADQWRRIFGLEGVRFDSNAFVTNWEHSLAGALYYQFSRANGREWSQSLVMSAAASAWWELVVEYKEVVSINDMIFTTVGGYSIGEPWYELGSFLEHEAPPSLRWLGIINPILQVNAWLDGDRPEAVPHTAAGWHAFSLFAAWRHAASSDGRAAPGLWFGLRTEIIQRPEYGRPGNVRETFRDTIFSEIAVDCAMSGGRVEETCFTSRAVSLAWFRQSIDAQGRGFSLSLGLGSRFSYLQKRPVWTFDAEPVPVRSGYDLRLDEPRNFADKLALIHAVGPALDWTIFRRDFKLRTTAEAYFDFGMINAFALGRYSALHDISGQKTTLLYYGYYYGCGLTFMGESALEWKSLRLRGAASFQAWGSLDFLDRFQEELGDDAHIRDGRLSGLAAVGLRLPGAPVEVTATFELVRRWGKIREVSALNVETRLSAGLKYGF